MAATYGAAVLLVLFLFLCPHSSAKQRNKGPCDILICCADLYWMTCEESISDASLSLIVRGFGAQS